MGVIQIKGRIEEPWEFRNRMERLTRGMVYMAAAGVVPTEVATATTAPTSTTPTSTTPTSTSTATVAPTPTATAPKTVSTVGPTPTSTQTATVNPAVIPIYIQTPPNTTASTSPSERVSSGGGGGGGGGFEPESEVPGRTPSDLKWSLKKKLAVGGGIGLLIAAGFGIYYYSKKGK